jgi:hypothetical protein
MPTFTSYPALQARGIDMPAIRDRAQQRQGQRTSNALRQAQLQEMQGAQGRRNQYNALVPQIIAGDQAAIGQGMAANPQKTAQIVDFYAKADKRKQDEFKQGLETQVNLMKVVQSAPVGRRAQMWGVALERAQAEGLNIKGAPTAYDDQWTSEQIALGEAVLGQIAKVPTPPTGYRNVPGGGVELRPGYLKGERALATTGAGGLTALQKDVPFIAKLAGISMKDALALKLESKDKSYDAYVRDLAARYASAGYGADRAFEQATAIGDLAYGRVKPPEAEPDSEEGRSWLQELFGFGGSGAAAEKPKAVPKAKADKNPSQMSVEDIRAYTQELKASGKKPPQAVLDALAARLSELGYN